MTQDVVPFEQRLGALTVADVRAQVNLIQHIMKEVMHKDEHYGVIPGTGTKPTLLKAGAEKLCLTFRLDPQYEIEQKNEGAHLNIVSKCVLWHIPSGQRFGSGMGSCSTREAKYAYRQASVKCPNCGKDAIIKGKDFKGDGAPTGWLCYAKKGGCGTKFLDGDEAIEKQPRGRIPNEDLADQYNTVLKMANKRSLVAAVLNATAASDIFTQDIEDMEMAAPQADLREGGVETSGNRTGGGAVPMERPRSTHSESPSDNRDSRPADAVAKVTPEQIEAIHVALSKHGVPIADLLAKAELTDLRELAASDAPGAIKWIATHKKAAAPV